MNCAESADVQMLTLRVLLDARNLLLLCLREGREDQELKLLHRLNVLCAESWQIVSEFFVFWCCLLPL